MAPAQHFRAFVARYLVSPRGSDTPDSVACALFKLDPELCGFGRHPCAERLHRFREIIQGVHVRPDPEPSWEPQTLYGRRYAVALRTLKMDMETARTAHDSGAVEPLRKAG
jgi:hypothetical protein